MLQETSRTMVIGGVIALTFAAFGAGFAMSPVLAGDVVRGDPIINPNAWAEQPAETIVQVASSEMVTAQCNPWEVSEIAMEEILREMLRRGWRAPSQGDALEMLDPVGGAAAESLELNAPMPSSYGGEPEVLVDQGTVKAPPVEGVLLNPLDRAETIPPTN